MLEKMRRQVQVLGILAGAVLIVVTLQSTLLAEAPDFSGRVLRIDVNLGPHVDSIRDLTEEWERVTGAKVEMRSMDGWPQRYNSEMLDFGMKRTSFDIIQFSNEWMGDMREHILVLDDFVKEYDVQIDKWIRTGLETYMWDGKLYALPYVLHTMNFWWRKDILTETGVDVPATYDDLLSAVRKVNLFKPNVYGFCGNAKPGIYPYWHWEVFLRAFGGFEFSENGDPDLLSPESLKATEYFVDLYKHANPASTTWDHFSVFDNYASGDAVFTLVHTGLGDWYFLQPEKSKVADVLGFNIPPAQPLPDGSVRYGHVLSNWAHAIPKYSPNIDMAKHWLYFVGATPAGQQEAYMKGGMPISSYLAVTPESLLSRPGEVPMATLAANLAVPKPYLKGFMEMANIIGRELSSAVAGLVTPRQAMENAQKELLGREIKHRGDIPDYAR